MNEFPEMSDKQMAQIHTAMWGKMIGLPDEQILYYVESIGNSMEQFSEFGVDTLSNDIATELLDDQDTIDIFADVGAHINFNAVVASTVASMKESIENNNSWTAIMQLQFSINRAALIWAYLYGYRRGQADNTDTNSFNDFISELDIN